MTSASDWDDPVPVEQQTFRYFVRGMRTLWKLTVSEHSGFMKAGVALVVVQLIFLAPSLLFSRVVDMLPHVKEPGAMEVLVWLVSAIILAELVGIAVHRFVQETLFVKSAWRLENALPVQAHKKLLSLSMLYHERENTGKKISSVSKGVERLMAITCDMFWGVLPEVMAILFRAAALLYVDWRLAILVVAPMVPAAYVYAKQYARFAPVWERYEKLKDTSVGLFCQSLICIDTVQRYVQEGREGMRHASVRRDMRDLDITASIEAQKYSFVMEALLRVGFCGTIAVGVWCVATGRSSPGAVAFAFIAGNATIRGFTNLIQLYSRIMRNLFATERMQVLLDEPLDVVNYPGARTPEHSGGELSFERVSLRYPGKSEPTIEHLSLRIPRGQMVAFVGRSGAGKSTIARLVARVCDPTEGAVCLNRQDIRYLNRDWYRRSVAVVPQDVQILEGTIKENITYAAPDATAVQVARAVEAACLDEIVADTSRFPRGLETEVGERGIRLSGGERQRVGIARAYIALLNGATTLILDEATASLDSHSERVVQSFIERLRGERSITIIAIAHRLSTIKRADKIIVLEQGSIIESGDHAKLLMKNGLYAQLVRLQELGGIEKGDPAALGVS